jgi:two-component system NarL family sensor kinase
MTNDISTLERRNAELSVLNQIAQALNAELDLDRALRTTLSLVVRLMELQVGWIWLTDDDGSNARLAVSQNLPPALADHPHRMKGSTWCTCIDDYQEGDLSSAANINVIKCSRLKDDLRGTDGLRYHATVPIYAHGKKLGLMNATSADERALTPDELRLLSTIGDMLGMAIERARLFRRGAETGAAEERTRIAREIHDTLAQDLTAIALQLETADALLEADHDPGKVRSVVTQALVRARQGLDETRRSVMNLRAAPLEGHNIADALAVLANDYGGRWGLAVETDLKPVQDVPPHIENGLFRIAQEAFSNIARHAGATGFKVALSQKRGYVKLVITDDGRGFDSSEVPDGRYGLVGMSERALLLGGQCTISTAPGQGTRIEVQLPVEARG